MVTIYIMRLGELASTILHADPHGFFLDEGPKVGHDVFVLARLEHGDFIQHVFKFITYSTVRPSLYVWILPTIFHVDHLDSSELAARFDPGLARQIELADHDLVNKTLWTLP